MVMKKRNTMAFAVAMALSLSVTGMALTALAEEGPEGGFDGEIVGEMGPIDGELPDGVGLEDGEFPGGGPGNGELPEGMDFEMGELPEGAAPMGGGGPAAQEGNSFAVTSEPVALEEAVPYTVTIATTNSYIWGIQDGADVTSWLMTGDGSPVFSDESGIAVIHYTDNSAAEITIDLSKVTGFAAGGIQDIYLQPSGGDILNDMGYAIGITTDAEVVGSISLPEVTVNGAVTASGNTNGASCLVEDENNQLVFDEEGAQIVLTMEGLEDSKIDTSQVSVAILPGDGYSVNDFILGNSGLGECSDGKISYNLTAADLKWNNSEYAITQESGCGLEWSCFGGDGAGNYRIRLGLSGLKYNGLPLGNVVIPVQVSIYGRSATDLAISDYKDISASWSWEGAGEKPILCDEYEDVFTAKWPADVDASAVTEADISVVLKGEYGDELTLTAGEDFTLASASSGETKVTVRYQNWAFTPVYTTMDITVNDESLSYDREVHTLHEASHTMDIASVYAYSVQSGGNMDNDHAVSYNYYGVNIENWEQVQQPAIYRLTTKDEAGKTLYYAEDGTLTESIDEAAVYDGTGEEDMNYTVVDHHVVYLTLCSGRTEDKQVGDETITFSKEYDCAYESTAMDFYGSFEPISQELETLPGYVLGESWLQHAMWAWKPEINLGWTE